MNSDIIHTNQITNMKITRNKSSLQNQLAKMLQAGKENIDNSTDNEKVKQDKTIEQLYANAQEDNASAQENGPVKEAEPKIKATAETATELQAEPVSEARQQPKSYRSKAAISARARSRKAEEEAPRLNAAQRHEVPDRNAKYAGEPIKSVGCRMPQSLYARMLQYKALNDTQLNRITLNDVIIEAVDKFLSKMK